MADIIEKLGYLAGGSRFRRIYEKMKIDGDKAYKEAGFNFKSSWFPVYYTLSKAQCPQTVMEITGQIAFSHITVKNIIKELDKERLINIIPNPNDKRSKLISLSDKGLQLLEQLEPIWLSFSLALKNVLTSGHPDIMNILNRIDMEINLSPLNERVYSPNQIQVSIVDYNSGLKKYFYELAGLWLFSVQKGILEEADEFAFHNPDIAYLQNGGFLFYAKYQEEIVGCVALKRLDETNFEFANLFVATNYRNLGIATKLLERCISRCKENEARYLWFQTSLSRPQTNRLYYKLGFKDKEAPSQMTVLKRTEKIMCLEL